MCGRYTISKAQEVLGTFFGAEFSETHIPIFNASPNQHLPAILDIQPDKILRVLWGITPEWTHRKSRLLINARAETIKVRPAFRESFEQRRCLVIADGFYEWQATKDGKQPFRITMRSYEPFAFAGIWQNVGPERAYVILTTDANEVTRPIHDRMPVILETEEHDRWLDQDLPIEDAVQLLAPYPSHAMTAVRVSKAVNSWRNQDSSLIEPIA